MNMQLQTSGAIKMDAGQNELFQSLQLDEVTIVRLSDFVDNVNFVDAIDQVAQLVQRERPQKVLINLGNVKSLQSVTAAKLLSLNATVEGIGGRLRLCNAGPDVTRMLSATRLTKVLQIDNDEQSSFEQWDAKLLVRTDDLATFRLTQTRTTLGRHRRKVDIYVDADTLSKQHCRIERVEGKLFVEDLGSRNGTFVNEERVTKSELHIGDTLQCGSVVFRLEEELDQTSHSTVGEQDDVSVDSDHSERSQLENESHQEHAELQEDLDQTAQQLTSTVILSGDNRKAQGDQPAEPHDDSLLAAGSQVEQKDHGNALSEAAVFAVENVADVCMVRLTRSIASDEFDNAITELSAQASQLRPSLLVLNLSSLRQIGSLSIGKLVTLNSQLEDRQGELAIAGLQRDVEIAIRRMRLDKLIAIYETEQECLIRCRIGQPGRLTRAQTTEVSERRTGIAKSVIQVLSARRIPIVSGLIVVGLVALIVPFIAGEPRTDVKTVPVSGQVTLDGSPLANVAVTFAPIPGTGRPTTASPDSFGLTDNDGRFALKWTHGNGAVLGKHRVILVWNDPSAASDHITSEKRRKAAPHADEKKAGDAEMIGYVQLEPDRHFKLPHQARDGSEQFVVPEGGTDEANFAFTSP